jgi:hypothetical protein
MEVIHLNRPLRCQASDFTLLLILLSYTNYKKTFNISCLLAELLIPLLSSRNGGTKRSIKIFL